jgi:DNA-binding transcriptional MocR family regulator
MAGSDVSELLALLGRSDLISFAGGIPDPSLFPTEAIRAAYDATLGDPRQAATALQYSVPEGDPDLRAWIAEDMRRRGVRCAAETCWSPAVRSRLSILSGNCSFHPARRS